MDETAVNSLAPGIGIGPVSVRGDASANACPSQTQPVHYEGYQDMFGRWATCYPDGSAEGSGKGPQGIYSDNNRSHLFPGYGYTLDARQKSSTSLPMLMPSVGHYGQSYNGQELPNVDSPYYQHIAAQTPMSHHKFPVQIEFQGDDSRFRPRATYSSSWGSFGGGSHFEQNSEGMKYRRQGLEGAFESRGLWSSYSKPANGKISSFQLASPTVYSKSAGSGFGMASLAKGSFSGFGSHLGSNYKSIPQGRSDGDLGSEFTRSSMLGINGQNWPTLDEARQVGRCHEFPCSCAVGLDTLSERNRGPRAFKPKSPAMTNESAIDHCGKQSTDLSYNRMDFVTDYEDAKFFIIKSYSEDNVHKSIKYGVWASTQNGNKKLDGAYHEAGEKKKSCPVFLLFSVNASAQFCGVAEMVGAVDFDRSVDYWQQDKWSGQFPVKWHIIKDVPNSQFRHIVLENNDNKPVTNSRDTQEVELEQGIEMLKIFKNYESYSSILDDFHFYEERQKATQARKSRQVTLASAPLIGVDIQTPISLSSDFIKRMSKSFAEAVSVNENGRKFSL